MQDLRAAILANATVLKRERMVQLAKQAQQAQETSKRNSVQFLGARKGSIITKTFSNGNGKEHDNSNGRNNSTSSVEAPKRFWMDVITRSGDWDGTLTKAVILYRNEEFGESTKFLESLEKASEQEALLCLLQRTKEELKEHFDVYPLLMTNEPEDEKEVGSAGESQESLGSA